MVDREFEHGELGFGEHKDDPFLDIDRMVNEGLGGGNVSPQNGLIEETTTDTMNLPESITNVPESTDALSEGDYVI